MTAFRHSAASTIALTLVLAVAWANLAAPGMSEALSGSAVVQALCCDANHQDEADPVASCELVLCPCKVCAPTLLGHVVAAVDRELAAIEGHVRLTRQFLLSGFSFVIERPPEFV